VLRYILRLCYSAHELPISGRGRLLWDSEFNRARGDLLQPLFHGLRHTLVLYRPTKHFACSEADGPSKVEAFVYLQRNSNSTPVAQWQIMDCVGTGASSSPANGHYSLVADNMSQAIAYPMNPSDNLTFAFVGLIWAAP